MESKVHHQKLASGGTKFVDQEDHFGFIDQHPPHDVTDLNLFYLFCYFFYLNEFFSIFF